MVRQLELCRRNEPDDGQMLLRRLQILSQRQDVDTMLDKNDESLAPIFDNLTENQREQLDYAIDGWWKNTMSYARDEMWNLLYDHLPTGTFDDD